MNLEVCYPAWHATFAPLVGGPAETILHSGCAVDAAGDVACDPEAMRSSAERQLQNSSWWPAGKPLTLDTYALARNIQSEVGAATPEARVALAESTVNQAAQRGISPSQLILTAKNLRGRFGKVGGGRGRFTASSTDPSILAVLIADFVLAGQSGNFAKGANDQDGLEYHASFPSPMVRIRQYAKDTGSYWVGPLPGVDHWLLSLFAKYDHSATSPEGQALIARAEQYFGAPQYDSNGRVVADMRPVWSLALPICGGAEPVVQEEIQSTHSVDVPAPAPQLAPQPASQPTLVRPRQLPPKPRIVQLPARSSPLRDVLVGFAAIAGLGALSILTYRLTAMRTVPVIHGAPRRRYTRLP